MNKANNQLDAETIITTDLGDYDVIIIGCGLVGGSLALTLPQSLSIAVIDAESPMQKQPGYLALNIHSCDILKRFGIWEDIARHIPSNETGQSISPITSIQQIDISEINQPLKQLILQAEDIGSHSLGYITSTAAIRETLLKRIESQKNITLYCPEQAEEIQWPNEGVEEVAVKLSQKNVWIRAKLVIMADGGRSELRSQLGFNIEQQKIQQHIFITRLKTYRPHHGLAFERFTPEGPIALLPTNQDEYLLIWTMNDHKLPSFLAQDEKELLAKLNTTYNTPTELSITQWKEIGERKYYPIRCNFVKNPIKTRFLLMGNAAHTVHPVGAQGFNLSLKDVLTLSNLIQEAINHRQNIGSQSLLQRYVASRQQETGFVLYFTQFLLNVFSPGSDSLALTKIRSLGLSWINQANPIKQYILKKTTGRNIHLPLLKKKPSSLPKQYDIIILGNRLIGSTLACALDSSYRIAILDKAPTPSIQPNADYELRINAYNRASEELLKTIGIWEKLPKDRCFAFDKIWATSEERTTQEAAHLAFCSSTIHEPHIGHFIENDWVTYYLHQQIKSLPHIDFFDDASVVDIIPSEKEIQIITTGGDIFSGKLLAACDGGHSIARNLLDIDVTRHPYHQRCIVGNIFFDGDLDRTAWQRFLKTGPLGLLPLGHGICSLAWSCDNATAKALLSLNDEAFIEQLNRATLGRLGKIIRISPRQSFPLMAQHANTYTAQRTILLGDAAHTIHPLGGLGANLGFQDVIAATQLLNHAKISRRDIGRRYLLSQYEQKRRRHNAIVMSSMTAFNALFHQNNPTLNPLGHLSLRFANKITPIKNKLFKEAMWMGSSKKAIQTALNFENTID